MFAQQPNWAQILSGVGSVAAVMVALFVNVVRAYLGRPKLRIACGNPKDAVRAFKGDEVAECWAALTVINVGRRDTARDVEVFVSRIAWAGEASPSAGKSYERLPRWPAY